MKTPVDYAHAKAEAIRKATGLILGQLEDGLLTVDEAETVLLQIVASPTVIAMQALAEVVADVAAGKMTVPEAQDWLL